MINYLITDDYLYLILLGIFSLLMGSFLNVVIYRLPRMLKAEWQTECELLLNPDKAMPAHTPVFNLFLPRSACQDCKKTIPFWHNLPILSFLLLKGRCCFCQSKISWQYPFIELTCLILSLAAALHFGFNLTLLYALCFIWILICLAGIDLKHQLLPDSLTLGLLWLGLLANTEALFTSLPNAIFGAISGYLVLWMTMKLFYLCTKKVGMGHGDFKLLAAFGAWFGWVQLPLLLLSSSLMGAVVGIIYLKTTQQSKETPIPFGPFLCLSGLFILFFGKSWMVF
jgi:leader peptidase (prepilin peptidase)/N-methyltransferase